MYKINLQDISEWHQYYTVMCTFVRTTGDKDKLQFTKNQSIYEKYEENIKNKEYCTPIEVCEKNGPTSIKKEDLDRLGSRYRNLLDPFRTELSTKMEDILNGAGFHTYPFVCPYCSMPNNKHTFEHHLEKSKHPEYIVYPLNLIPACNNCNQNDKYKYCDFHPYFDELEYIFSYSFEMQGKECHLNVGYQNNHMGKMMEDWDDVNIVVVRGMREYFNQAIQWYEDRVLHRLDEKLNQCTERYGKYNWITHLFESCKYQFKYLIDKDIEVEDFKLNFVN